MFCLSKGLCAPVGSLLAGTKDFISEARLKRKIMGGGMRQAGVLAAAGIIALEEHSLLLEADHLRAKQLAQGLAKIKGVSVNGSVDINMVFFSCQREAPPKAAIFHETQMSTEFADKIVKHFAGRGITINPPEQGMFRFVTHYWIGDKEIDTILAAAQEVFSGSLGGQSS
jgi:threonine aldolase